MRFRRLLPFTLVASLILLGACENLKDNVFLRGDVTVGGVTPLIEKESFQKIDLARQLNPDSKGLSVKDGAEDRADPIKLQDDRDTLRKAFEAFYSDPTGQKLRRNRVQERILAASNQRCGEYKTFLKEMDATTNFILGSATTAVAGAGAIFTRANTVRALAGIASILSGIRSEFNEDYFANLTIQVISDGFESSRRELYRDIQQRQRLGLSRYPVEAAIKDAIDYHERCSLLAGLEHAALSIQRVENPGLKGARRALVEARALQHIMEAPTSELFPLGVAQAAAVPGEGGILFGFALDGGLIGSGSPLETYGQAINKVKQFTKDFGKKIGKLKEDDDFKLEKDDDFKKKKAELEKLKKRAKSGESLALRVLLTQTMAKANAENTNIRLAELAVIETIDAVKRSAKEKELSRAILKGKKVIVDISIVFFTFQSNIVGAESDLDNEKLGGPGTRIEAARKKLDTMVQEFAARQIAAMRAVLNALDPSKQGKEIVELAAKINKALGLSVAKKPGILSALKKIEGEFGDSAKIDGAVVKLNSFADAVKSVLKKDV